MGTLVDDPLAEHLGVDHWEPECSYCVEATLYIRPNYIIRTPADSEVEFPLDLPLGILPPESSIHRSKG